MSQKCFETPPKQNNSGSCFRQSLLKSSIDRCSREAVSKRITMSFDKFKPKYKIHEETENYFKLRAEAGAKPYDQLTVEEAREGNIANAKRFAGTTEFEGTVKEFTVPTKHCSDGKIHHFSLCITHFKALVDILLNPSTVRVCRPTVFCTDVSFLRYDSRHVIS